MSPWIESTMSLCRGVSGAEAMLLQLLNGILNLLYRISFAKAVQNGLQLPAVLALSCRAAQKKMDGGEQFQLRGPIPRGYFVDQFAQPFQPLERCRIKTASLRIVRALVEF